MKVEGKVRHLRSIQGADFDFLKSINSRTPKMLLPLQLYFTFEEVAKQSEKGLIQKWKDFTRMLARLIRTNCVLTLSEE